MTITPDRCQLPEQQTEKSLTEFVQDYVKPPRLLVVEDDACSAELLVALLKDFEVEVIVSSTGKSAFERMANEKFDLIILDLGLPDRSYTDMARIIAEKQPFAPVVILSGVITERAIVTINAILDRPVWFIEKPFGFNPQHFIRLFSIFRLRALYKGKTAPNQVRLRYESGSSKN